ncbi:MAG: F0F1 ATP synthase subunit delta [Rhodospirillales bacterium]|nr:F0F1 ATP synthase subunit delta [Rhodospirillales bacterium]
MTSATTASAGLAERYATALFELAEAEKKLDPIANELKSLNALIDSSADLRRLIRSPVISRQDQAKAMAAVLEQAGARKLTQKFVGLLAEKRRLFALPVIITAFLGMLARRRGEVTAEVTSAKPLSKAQSAALADALKAAMGKPVALTARVDADILGGLVVQIGSQMIDSSLRSKLRRLSIAMKGTA